MASKTEGASFRTPKIVYSKFNFCHICPHQVLSDSGSETAPIPAQTSSEPPSLTPTSPLLPSCICESPNPFSLCDLILFPLLADGSSGCGGGNASSFYLALGPCILIPRKTGKGTPEKYTFPKVLWGRQWPLGKLHFPDRLKTGELKSNAQTPEKGNASPLLQYKSQQPGKWVEGNWEETWKTVHGYVGP